MINYYKQLGGEYINHYYTYLPEYIDCAVTRRVSTDDYNKDVSLRTPLFKDLNY